MSPKAFFDGAVYLLYFQIELAGYRPDLSDRVCAIPALILYASDPIKLYVQECKIYLGVTAPAQLVSYVHNLAHDSHEPPLILRAFRTFCSTWLLVLRVGALYGRNKRIMRPLYALFIASYVTATGFAVFSAVVLISASTYLHWWTLGLFY